MEELDPKSYKLLKRLSKKSHWTEIKDTRIVHELFDKHYIVYVDGWSLPPDDKTGKYKITDLGKTYILNHKQATRHRWIPIGISILALIVSLIALLKP